MRSQGSEIEEPGKVREEKKHALPLELISAQYIQCQGAGNDIFKPAILFDFASNVLLSSLSVLSVSSGTEIMVENKRQGILPLFQWIEFSMFLGYLESIRRVCKCFSDCISNPLGKKSSLLSPLPFGDFPLSHSSTLWNFRDPPSGVWIFSGTTQLKARKH